MLLTCLLIATELGILGYGGGAPLDLRDWVT